jgi:hypothetical protein
MQFDTVIHTLQNQYHEKTQQFPPEGFESALFQTRRFAFITPAIEGLYLEIKIPVMYVSLQERPGDLLTTTSRTSLRYF